MANLLWIAGVDVEATLGHGIRAMPNWRGGYRASRPTIAIPDAPVTIEGPETVEARTIRLTLMVGNATIQTPAERAAAVSALVALSGSGREYVTIRAGDQTGRWITGRLLTHAVEPVAPYMEMTVGVPWLVTLDFQCPDPRWTATNATTLSNISTTPVAIPAGTAEFDWTLTISGGTNPVITVRDHDGNTVGTMTLDGDFTGETVTIRGGGVQSISTTLDLSGASPYSLLANWDTESWIRFRPEWWDFRVSDWMDIAISSGTGQLVYRPVWRE